VSQIEQIQWISGEAVDKFVGDGPLITDDRPLPEYFLLRRAFGPPSPAVNRGILLEMTGG
jgi:hypothetical protein